MWFAILKSWISALSEGVDPPFCEIMKVHMLCYYCPNNIKEIDEHGITSWCKVAYEKRLREEAK